MSGETELQNPLLSLFACLHLSLRVKQNTQTPLFLLLHQRVLSHRYKNLIFLIHQSHKTKQVLV
jgi:hypothetical protein